MTALFLPFVFGFLSVGWLLGRYWDQTLTWLELWLDDDRPEHPTLHSTRCHVHLHQPRPVLFDFDRDELVKR